MGVQLHEVWNWARRRKIFASLLVACTLGIGILIGTVIPGHTFATRAQTSSGAELLTIPKPVALSNIFASISKNLEPAVVNISTTEVIERPKGDKDSHALESTPLGNFFDRFFNSPDDAPDAERSLGSGVIVDPKGFILTNNHVIDGATKIQVSLDGDPMHYSARVIGFDKDTDLAVIKIDVARELPIAKLGNSDGVQVGDWVLAFGSPFGLNSTVTSGIVSAKNRAAGTQFQRFIQTDAAINPGNSGGPLVSMNGDVIGINTAIYTGSQSFEGVGFALPSNTAINVYNQLVTHGKVTRGSIGVKFQEDNSDTPILMKELGAPYGIVIEWVAPGSPAEKAGIKPGDVITTVDGKPVHNGTDLVNPISQTPIGHNVRIQYVRNKEIKEVSLPVADRDKLFPESAQDSDQQPDQPKEPGQYGLHVEQLTPDLSQKLGIGKLTGVIVTEVEPASFAEDTLFSRGDVIVEINHAPISSMADYHAQISKLKIGDDVLFKVERRDSGSALTVFLAGQIPPSQ
ncbi:MAG: Do family serine endopeptidase [Candidatus Acidiferrales bacterium]